MKKTFILFSLLILSILFLSSCARGFSPMYYYNRTSNSSSSTNDDILPPDIGGGEENLSPDEDPFHPDYGDWNRPDYGFSLNFDDYVIEASFNDKNQPTYKLVKKNGWYVTDALRNEYAYNGPDTTGGGVTMGSVKYYLYKSKNPNFNADSSYNKSTRMERFYFYRFTATAAGQPTDNYLIAIDTYSKLVFAFGVPTSWRKIAGIPAPNQWGPVELGWEADANNNSRVSFANVEGIQYFYEYDPVGIVKDDGTIEVYQWCLDSIANNRYAPRFDGEFGDTNRAIADYGVPGRSPYMPMKKVVDNRPVNKMNITVSQVSIKNVSAKSANRYALSFTWGKGDIQRVFNYAHFQYRFKMAAYNEDNDVPAVETIGSVFPEEVGTVDAGLGAIFGSVGSRDDAKYKIDIGSSKIITTDKTYEIEYYEEDKNKIRMDFYFDLVKFDEPMWNVTQIEWPYKYCENNKIRVSVYYDYNSNKFTYDASNGADDYGNRLVSATFEGNNGLSEGQEVDFIITVDGNDGPQNNKCGNGATGLNDTVELRFKLKFNKVQ
ncbi:hypothetical protein [Brachyspira pilosicoli]|uniref:Lipoprotein n=1 Tax=Brachyspira pilosicoli TaxID=52584 RepID=A0A5C8F9Q8_BRAPL|nr:hypothetical protein [Brachyspira pilosicoli]TXJ47007.1 hypothetical protein EPJ72_00935 [Brachyspira pilosicoli]